MPLTNSQYNTIMRTYEERQVRNRDRLNEHFKQAYDKIPELREIDQQISKISLEQAKKLLNGDEAALNELKDQIASLTCRKSTLLLENGFPADFLEETYKCNDCKDTGYVDNKKCRCFLKETIDLFYTQSNLSGILEKENFDHFSFDYYSSNYIDPLSGLSSKQLATKAYTECMNFIKNLDTEHGNLLLFGTTGIGKTFLSHCIAKEAMQTIHSVLYLTATELFDALLDIAIHRTDESQMLYEQIQNCDLLIIDDLGTERNTDFVVSQLFVCLNDRILNNKSTIISTNLSLNKIKENYTERTFSRISNHFKIIRLAGDDIRIQKRLMNKGDI